MKSPCGADFAMRNISPDASKRRMLFALWNTDAITESHNKRPQRFKIYKITTAFSKMESGFLFAFLTGIKLFEKLNAGYKLRQFSLDGYDTIGVQKTERM